MQDLASSLVQKHDPVSLTLALNVTTKCLASVSKIRWPERMNRSKAKRAIPDSDSEQFAKDRELDVLSQIERLRQELSELSLGIERGIPEVRDKFTNEALGKAAQEITRVARDETLPKLERREELRRIQQLVSNEADRLELRIPEVAPELWRDRDKSLEENPYQFAYRVYEDYYSIMTRGDLQKIDKSLTVAMVRHDQKYGPPTDHTFLPLKLDSNEDLIASVTWQQILDSASEETLVLLRAYQTQNSRKQSANKKPNV